MNKKLCLTVLFLVSCFVFALTAFSQAQPDVQAKQRRAAMTLQAKYFVPLMGMAQGKVPYDAKVVARNAGYLEVLSKLPWDDFESSAAADMSITLPAVYADNAKFKQAANDLQIAVARLAAASKGKDEAATKAMINGAGKTCGACHELFRPKPQ